jgi:preprotein translocase subunit YajC
VQFLIIMALMLGVMYVLMIRPQRQRQAQQQATINEAGIGDDVLTTGGIYGTITQVEDDDVVVEIAQGITVHMTRRGIAAVLPPDADEEDGEEEVEEDDDVVEGELVPEAVSNNGDEAVVMDGEEAVTSALADSSAEDEHR